MSAGAFALPQGWRDQPEQPVAFGADGSSLSRRQFRADLSANVSRLRELPGDAAILRTDSLYWFAVGLLALAACRKHAIVAGNALPASLMGLADLADLVVSDREHSVPVAQHRLHPGDPASAPEWPRIEAAAQISFFTSGSTSTPKRIDKQLHHLIAEAEAISKLFARQLAGFLSVCGTVPHHHAYGLAFRLIWPLLAGIPFLDETAEFPEQALARLGAGAVLVTSPAHLNRLDGLPQLPMAKHPACILSAGAPLGAEAASQAQALLGCVVTEIYGSTETGALACRRHDHPGEPWRPLPGVSLALASSGQAEACASHIPDGRASLADGIRLRGDADTGFDLLGRMDRIVKIEAKRVSLDAVEARLRELDDVADAVVIARGEPARLAACVVPSPAGADFLANQGAFRFNRRLRAGLALHLEAAGLPRDWRFVEQLPRGALGKASQHDIETLFDE